MADPQVKTAPIGYGLGLTLLTAMVANWEKVRPILEWCLLIFGAAVLHPLTQAAVIGTLIGTGVAWRLPHDLPNYFQQRETVTRLRWYCSGLTWVVTFALYPQPMGIAVGAVAALLGQYLLICAVRTFYQLFPALKPSSMKPNHTAGGEDCA